VLDAATKHGPPEETFLELDLDQRTQTAGIHIQVQRVLLFFLQLMLLLMARPKDLHACATGRF
jgi:hypothetical protein